MTNYAKGTRAERAFKKLLEAEAVHVVRMAGSHGWCDLVAFFKDKTVAYQVKTAKPTRAEIAALRAASKATACEWKMIWWDRGKATEIEL